MSIARLGYANEQRRLLVRGFGYRIKTQLHISPAGVGLIPCRTNERTERFPRLGCQQQASKLATIDRAEIGPNRADGGGTQRDFCGS